MVVTYSAEDAKYQASQITIPTTAAAGSLQATVTNSGDNAWPAGAGYYLSFVLQTSGRCSGQYPDLRRCGRRGESGRIGSRNAVYSGIAR